MMTFQIFNEATGQNNSYRLKLYEELTVGDYKLLTDIPWNDMQEDWDTEGKCDVVEKYCNIPTDVAMRLPMNELQAVYAKAIEQLKKAKEGSDAFNAAIKENLEYIPPREIEIGEKTYVVPYDLEMETIAAQWADWQAWNVPEQEADLIAEACAFMLVEVGQEYSGTPKDKIAEMMRLNLCEAFDLCAFFFAKSERFRSVTDHRRIAYLTLIQQRVEAALRLSTKGIEDSTFFSAPPNLNLSSGPSSETTTLSDPA